MAGKGRHRGTNLLRQNASSDSLPDQYNKPQIPSCLRPYLQQNQYNHTHWEMISSVNG